MRAKHVFCEQLYKGLNKFVRYEKRKIGVTNRLRQSGRFVVKTQ